MSTYKGSTDQPARIDMFGIGNYISGLCSFITDCDTPMTIAIQGDWGSGKSSVMEMVRDNIDKNAVHCVWFNTWQFSQFSTDASLPLSLLQAIIDGFDIEEADPAKKIGNDIGRICAAVAKRAAYAAMELTIGGTTAGDIKEAINKSNEDIKGVNEIVRTLKDRFQECIDTAIKKKNVDRILVFIDDLDRLQPIRAVELLEVLKIFLDCERCVFVLAIDYNVVVNGVKSKYGRSFDATKGRSFFDKIIQVPFKMPVAQYDISSFVKTTLIDVAGIECNDEDVKNYVTLINSSIGSNPRSMKRLFNSFLLLLKVVDKGVLDNVSDKRILFAVLCMQQRFDNLYNYIVLNRENIEPEFFSRLALSDNPESVLKQEGIESGAGEAEAIQEFVKGFNKTITTMIGEDSISPEDWDRTKLLLSSSSVTSTETTPKATKKRPTFGYKGDTYQPRGANKMNLGNLALRLIQDYAKESDKSTDEFMSMINNRIPCYYTEQKRVGLFQIADRSNPMLKHQEHQKRYFTDLGSIVRLGGNELLVSTGWGVGEIAMLIDILGYGDKVIFSGN